jgi:succinate dehydrogenase hydrophobic anchor subunit
VPRSFKVTAIAYLAILGMVVAVGAYRFQHLYTPSLPPEAARRSIAYARYLWLTQPMLAVLVGTWSGLLGAHHRSLGTGLLGLVAGVALTAVVYAFLPVCYSPGIDMTAWLLWLANAYTFLAAWILATLLAHQFHRRRGVRSMELDRGNGTLLGCGHPSSLLPMQPGP